eukprot:3023751-Lingulodinium_polyedra.AAC.1
MSRPSAGTWAYLLRRAGASHAPVALRPTGLATVASGLGLATLWPGEPQPGLRERSGETDALRAADDRADAPDPWARRDILAG